MIKGLFSSLPNFVYPPGDLGAPLAAPILESVWLEPLPDAWLPEPPADPEARYLSQERLSLAFTLALQLLPPRQRAVLIVCDVLDWSATEAAEALEMTVSAVNSALHRARSTLAENRPTVDVEPRRIAPDGHTVRATVEQYVRAIQNADVGDLVELLKEAATFTMPPIPTWFRGRAIVASFLAQALFSDEAVGRWRILPAGANGQPAFGLYQLDSGLDRYQAFALQVLTLDPAGKQISGIVNFTDARLFGRFNLPPELPRTPGPPP